VHFADDNHEQAMKNQTITIITLYVIKTMGGLSRDRSSGGTDMGVYITPSAKKRKKNGTLARQWSSRKSNAVF